MLGLVKPWLTESDFGQWLMVIDNTDDGGIFFGPSAATTRGIATGSEQRFARYIPRNPKGSILFTTRNKQVGLRLTGSGELTYTASMKPIEVENLFKDRLSPLVPEQKTMEELLELLDYLPLAIV